MVAVTVVVVTAAVLTFPYPPSQEAEVTEAAAVEAMQLKKVTVETEAEEVAAVEIFTTASALLDLVAVEKPPL